MRTGHFDDGVYLIDVDGTGPLAPEDVYCDMTNGAWTLVYKIANDVPDTADPWWDMVDTGSGDAFPSAPTPVAAGSHFEGATQATRAVYARSLMSPTVELRATLIDATGAVILDVLPLDLDRAFGRIATGSALGPPMNGCGGTFSVRVLAAHPPSLFVARELGNDCASLSGGNDSVTLHDSLSSMPPEALVGDSSIGEPTTTTLFWIRSTPP